MELCWIAGASKAFWEHLWVLLGQCLGLRCGIAGALLACAESLLVCCCGALLKVGSLLWIRWDFCRSISRGIAEFCWKALLGLLEHGWVSAVELLELCWPVLSLCSFAVVGRLLWNLRGLYRFCASSTGSMVAVGEAQGARSFCGSLTGSMVAVGEA